MPSSPYRNSFAASSTNLVSLEDEPYADGKILSLTFISIVPLGNWASVHRWTLSGHLWDAQNSFDFFQDWSVKPFWIISAFKFEEFLQTGTGDDLDDFARNFLTV